DAVLSFEERAKADPAFAAYSSIHNRGAWMSDSVGSDEQRARWIPDLAGRSRMPGNALTGRGAGADAAALQARSGRD
ncbi:acyl-CoA dehydrogenase family protein, partial [Micrococcus sp. SIMBA_144]